MLQDIKHIGQIAIEIHIDIYYTITLRHQIFVTSSNGGRARTDALICEKESLQAALIVLFII